MCLRTCCAEGCRLLNGARSSPRERRARQDAYQITRLRERSRTARRLIYAELAARDIRPDHNLLLTAGLREELLQRETEQLLWAIVEHGEGDAVERQLVVLA